MLLFYCRSWLSLARRDFPRNYETETRNTETRSNFCCEQQFLVTMLTKARHSIERLFYTKQKYKSCCKLDTISLFSDTVTYCIVKKTWNAFPLSLVKRKKKSEQIRSQKEKGTDQSEQKYKSEGAGMTEIKSSNLPRTRESASDKMGDWFWSRAFSRDLGGWLVFSLSSHWLWLWFHETQTESAWN